MELKDSVYKEILRLSNDGDQESERGNFDTAITKYENALELIPKPLYDWEASTWLLAAIGDAYFLKNNYTDALNYFKEVLKCPGGLDNPFPLLRIGQSYFELMELSLAKEYLLKSYMLAGDEIFQDEDQKYFNLLNIS